MRDSKQPRKQMIQVNTKGGLIAAFYAAKDLFIGTHITLHRKTGETVFEIQPYDNGHVFYIKLMNKRIMKSIAKIRKIPAADLLY